MPAIVTDDGVEAARRGDRQGDPLLFVHEFAGDHRSWEPQVTVSFSAAYRCVTYAATRLPAVGCAHRPGGVLARSARSRTRSPCSTASRSGGHTWSASRWAASPPCTWRSSTPSGSCPRWVAGAGYGAEPERAEAFRAESRAHRGRVRGRGSPRRSPNGTQAGPARVQFQKQEPARVGRVRRGTGRPFLPGQCPDHARRPGRTALAVRVRRRAGAHHAPVLVLVGDEDEGCLEPALMLKRTIPTAGLTVLPTYRPHRQPGRARRLQPRLWTASCPAWTAARGIRGDPRFAFGLDHRHGLTRRRTAPAAPSTRRNSLVRVVPARRNVFCATRGGPTDTSKLAAIGSKWQQRGERSTSLITEAG